MQVLSLLLGAGALFREGKLILHSRPCRIDTMQGASGSPWGLASPHREGDSVTRTVIHLLYPQMTFSCSKFTATAVNSRRL